MGAELHEDHGHPINNKFSLAPREGGSLIVFASGSEAIAKTPGDSRGGHYSGSQ